jgi:murein L,D-transpeptidase YafK
MALRATLLALTFATALAGLTGCQDDSGLITTSKEVRPLKPELVELMDKKGMRKEYPILLRIYKDDSELEVWKQNNEGRYAFLKSYKICAWGGKLGPKITQGDYQSPEGFYQVKPSQMNPKSSYYLAFDIGYPNSFDKAYNRTGGDIMVHGDCSSSGCFAMTDPQVEEIYALAREAFAGGQRSFQVQSLPFRMTAKNMAKYRSSPHFAFWQNLKEGADHFELTGIEPKVDVCNKRYVFDAVASDPAAATFQPAGACPVYTVKADIAAAMAAKAPAEEKEFQVALAAFDAEAKEKAEVEAKKAKVEAEQRALAQKEAEEKRLAALQPPKPMFSWLSSDKPKPSAPAQEVAKAAPTAPGDKPWWQKINPF